MLTKNHFRMSYYINCIRNQKKKKDMKCLILIILFRMLFIWRIRYIFQMIMDINIVLL